MCYFNNKNATDVTERDALQRLALNGNFNLDFYTRLKQVNLLSETCKNSNKFIDVESVIRKNLVAFLLLLNGEAFFKTKINKSEYNYNLNEFLFEMTLCENICSFIKASKNKTLYIKSLFLKNKFIITIKYKGEKAMPRNYTDSAKTTFKKGLIFNTATISFNCKTKKTKKPPKLNLDGYLKNRLSAVYITLCLSGLKRFN